MKRVLFACGEPTCPRTNDRTTKLESRVVYAVHQALSDRPVCSTCERPMGVYDVREESECERAQEEARQEEVWQQEEERIQADASGRYRAPA